MTHPNIVTKYIRDLFAQELYQAFRAMKGSRIENLYTNNFSSYRFGLDTAYHRIDQRIRSGELKVVNLD